MVNAVIYREWGSLKLTTKQISNEQWSINESVKSDQVQRWNKIHITASPMSVSDIPFGGILPFPNGLIYLDTVEPVMVQRHISDSPTGSNFHISLRTLTGNRADLGTFSSDMLLNLLVGMTGLGTERNVWILVPNEDTDWWPAFLWLVL